MREDSVHFTLHGHLWRHHAEGRRCWEAPWQEGSSIDDFLKASGIPVDQVMMVLVNGTRKGLAFRLRRGDHVELLPVVDGG